MSTIIITNNQLNLNSIFLFQPLTNVIDNIFIQNQDTIKNNAISKQQLDYYKELTYLLFLDLGNLIALGVTSKQYMLIHNLTDEKIRKDGKVSIRDYMTNEQLDKIKEVEIEIYAIIKYAKITKYEKIKRELIKRY